MYAIVDIAGQQFKVEKGQKIYVHRLESEEGENLDFDKVLLIDDEGKISIGEPVIEGAYIEGKILEHARGDKVIVFKKKRRKGYKVKNGHRQLLSHVEILSINGKGFVKKAAKAAAPKATEKKTVATKAKASTKSTEDKPKAAVKTSVASKQAADKKPAVKKEKAEASTSTKTSTAKKAPAKTTAAKKTTATKASGKKEEAKKPAAKKTTASAAKKPAAKKTTATKSKAAAKPATKAAASKDKKAE